MLKKVISNFFLAQEAGAFRNNMEKGQQKPRPKFKKYVYYIFTVNICSACNPMQVVAFCKNVLIFYNINSNFLTLKVVHQQILLTLPVPIPDEGKKLT